jgi:DNA primase
MGSSRQTKHKKEAAKQRTVSVSIPRRTSDFRLSPHSASRPATLLHTRHQPPTVVTLIIIDTNSHVVPEISQSRRQDSVLTTASLRARSNTRIAQPTTWRRSDDPEYQDDPEFNTFTTDLSDRLFSLTANISRLSSQVALLGTKRETDRVRERVQDLLEETSASFKDIGDGLKKVQAWHDLGVCSLPPHHICRPANT